MKKREKWTCPDCERSFKHPNQWHSCTTQTLEKHFEGKSLEVKELFDELVKTLASDLVFTLTPLKSEIYLTAESNFVAIYVRKEHLVIEFANGLPFMEERIHRTQQISKSLYIHHVKIRSNHDIDEQFLGWINEAYELTGK